MRLLFAGQARREQPSVQRQRQRGDEESVPPPPPPWQLSLQDEVVVRQLVQMVVWWGVLPRLGEGVGVPLSLRVKTGGTASVSVMHLVPSRTSSTPGDEDNTRLFECTKGLVELASSSEELRPFLVPVHLPDLLAALLQLAYRPSAPMMVGSEPPAKDVRSAMIQETAKLTPASVLSPFLPERKQRHRLLVTATGAAPNEDTNSSSSPQAWALDVLEGEFILMYNAPPAPSPLSH